MGKHIFLVDDEMVLNMGLSRFLEQNGYKTTMFHSGATCLHALSEQDKPDIILMDINFGPGQLTGPETTQLISENYDIPVILHSAYTDKETLESTKEMTKYGYICKSPGNEHFVLANIEMALKLHSSRTLYRELFHNSNEAIFLHSITEDGVPGTFLEVNDVACSYLGYTRDELLTMGPQDIENGIHAQNTDNVTFETEHRTKTGEVVPVEISSHQFYLNNQPIVIASARNVVLRKRMEQKVRESEELHRTTLGSMSDTVFLTDEEGNFKYVCSNVNVIFGYHENDIVSFGNIIHILGDVLASSFELEENGEMRNIECTITNKSGAERILLVNVKRVSIKGASRLYTCRDVTELKQKERELLQSEQMYRELSNHFQNIREEQSVYIAREIHDDFGQSLTALKMNLAMIENIVRNYQYSPETDKINETTKDMKQIVDGIVQKVRMLTSELHPPVLDTMGIIEAIHWHLSNFERQFNIPTYITCEPEKLELEKEKSLMVFRIVQEALTNSIRHGSPSEVYVSVKKNDSGFFLSVEDDGKGFSEEELRQKNTYGLIGMKERARQNGGVLEVNSEPGCGTRIKLYIPL